MAKRINQLEFQAELSALSGSADTKNPVRYFQLADVAMRYQPECKPCECDETAPPSSFDCTRAPHGFSAILDGNYNVYIDGVLAISNTYYKDIGVVAATIATSEYFEEERDVRVLDFENLSRSSHRIKLEATDASSFTEEALELAFGGPYSRIASVYSLVMTETTLEFCLGVERPVG